jgi:hypothetical protein
MVALTREARVPLILCSPAANLSDCPPFKAALSEQIPNHQQERFHELWVAMETSSDPLMRLDVLREMAAIDNRHGEVLYLLGKCYAELEMAEPARNAFLRAKDEDLCPLRILEVMQESISAVSRETSTPLVDVHQHIAARSPLGVPGSQWMLDHVHPTIEGHQFIAELLLAEVVRLAVVQPRDGWQTAWQRAKRAHTAALPEEYFEQARLRREGLRRWTEGRAFQTPGPAGL